jgi:outer membrane protein assembly factor BamB
MLILLTALILALAAPQAAQVPAAPAGPAAVAGGNWPQFRNTSALTGVAGSALSAAPKIRWTYDAGAAVESSAAIAGDTAYVGVSTGELLAIDLRPARPSGSTARPIPTSASASHRQPWPTAPVYIGDLTGVLHAVDAATGAKKWTFKTGAEIKSSPVVVGNRVLIGSYDNSLLQHRRRRPGKQIWKLQTENYVHATPSIWNGVAYFGGCDEMFHGVRLTDGVEVVRLATDAYTAASAAIANGVAYYGTFANEVVAIDIAAKKVKWRFEDPDRKFPYYSSAAIADGVAVLGGRDKNVRAIDLATGKQRGCSRRARGSSRRRRRRQPRGGRLERRQGLHAGPEVRREALGIRIRRRLHRVSRHRRRPHRDRRHRRQRSTSNDR